MPAKVEIQIRDLQMVFSRYGDDRVPRETHGWRQANFADSGARGVMRTSVAHVLRTTLEASKHLIAARWYFGIRVTRENCSGALGGAVFRSLAR